MRRLSALFVVCAILGETSGLAYAGACADQITQLRQATPLGHQPMAWQGWTYAQLMFSADLVQADALAAVGNEHDCLLAARRARHRLEH
jgi:hypothetical protein